MNIGIADVEEVSEGYKVTLEVEGRNGWEHQEVVVSWIELEAEYEKNPHGNYSFDSFLNNCDFADLYELQSEAAIAKYKALSQGVTDQLFGMFESMSK